MQHKSYAVKEMNMRIKKMEKDTRNCSSEFGIDVFNAMSNAKISLDNKDISNIEHQDIENKIYRIAKEFSEKCTC